MAGAVRLGRDIEIGEEVIMKTCFMAMEAHKYPERQYLSDLSSSTAAVVFGFPGSWSENDWFSTTSPFGEVKVDLQLFPSLKRIGRNTSATVNEAFLERFREILDSSRFKAEVGNAVYDGKHIVFTGHSSGGPIAILATVWFLEEYVRKGLSKISPLSVTYGSPLVGDYIMNHAIRRENWSRCFIHFVMRNDIVPRMSLTPFSAIAQQLQQILNFLNPNSPFYKQEPISEALGFFITVMENASSVASHAACEIMGSINPLLEITSTFRKRSPYRPFGAYIFCAGNGKLAVISNPDAVLQLLFYSSQLSPEEEIARAAQRSLRDHLNYKDELKECLQMHNITCLEDLPLPLRGAEVSMALNDLGLSERGKFCLYAVEELERQKSDSLTTVNSMKESIEKGIEQLEAYKSNCELRKRMSYYDAFKMANDEEDFKANVTRLELAGKWDEIVGKLKRHELPDNFEVQEEWVVLGSRYLRISEPLDIANFYRHLKNEGTGAYTGKGRPKRYQCVQRWRQHSLRMAEESLESCFWAEVEELFGKTGNPDVKDKVLNLEHKARKWIQNGVVSEDVFFENSTFKKLLNEVFSRPT